MTPETLCVPFLYYFHHSFKSAKAVHERENVWFISYICLYVCKEDLYYLIAEDSLRLRWLSVVQYYIINLNKSAVKYFIHTHTCIYAKRISEYFMLKTTLHYLKLQLRNFRLNVSMFIRIYEIIEIFFLLY